MYLVILKYSLYACLFTCPLLSALTYNEALQKTLIQSPALALSVMEIEEREGEHIQTGLYFNPVFAYSVENVFGNRHWRGWRAAESRYEISQALDLGCKREHRRNRAFYLIQAAQYGHAYLELETAKKMKKAFLRVVAAQELLKLAQNQQKISLKTLNVIQQKSDSGRVSLIEKNKAQLSLANSDLVLQRASVELEIAKEELSPFWGSSCPDFDGVEYPFFEVYCPPCYEECFQEFNEHPLLLKVQFEQFAAKAGYKFEQSSVIPEVVVTAGLKTIQDTGDKGMILGVAFPLPFFDQNQGSIARARAEKKRLLNQYCETELLLETRLSVLHKEAMRSYNEAVQLKETILTLAEASFEMVREAYAAGKLEYLDLLEAGRTLFDAQERYIQVLLSYFEKQTDIEYLTLL